MKEKGINVLSLFDGVSCGRLALERARIKVTKYSSSEISPSALLVQQHHYANDKTFHAIGDVRYVNGKDYSDTDLIIFGSPCTQLSAINSKDRSGLQGAESGLFYEAVRIIKEILIAKQKNNKLYVLMENTASMANSERDKISKELSLALGEDIKPIFICSSLNAPARRRRYYWTNIPGITMPEPSGIKFQDILECGYTDREKGNVILSTDVTLTNGIFRYYKRNIGNIIFKNKSFAKLPVEEKLKLYPSILKASGHRGKANAVRDEYDYVNNCFRHPSITEYSRMMTIPDSYIDSVPLSKTEKLKLIGLSFTVDVVAHLLKPLTKIYKTNE